MVKPTIGICCEIAQKKDAEFVKNFFEKPLDIFIRRVYNGSVPGKTGAKKKTLQQMQQNGGFYEQQHFYGAESTPCWN